MAGGHRRGAVLLIVGGPILIGEISLSLYLLIKGVSVAGWNRRQVMGGT